MDYTKLKKLNGLLYFTLEDLAGVLGIKRGSAPVLASRYVKAGLFIRLKNNFYVLDQNWSRYSRGELLKIANYLQVPSYISFMSALSFYEITTQVQRDFVESASLKRSRRFTVSGKDLNYYKLKKEHYFGFERVNGLFIATPEKAFIDSIYLYSFGKYRIDLDSLDIRKLDKRKIKKILRLFPGRTKEIVEKICKI
jgi:predicted transcriptional regulator of viral defense system